MPPCPPFRPAPVDRPSRPRRAVVWLALAGGLLLAAPVTRGQAPDSGDASTLTELYTRVEALERRADLAELLTEQTRAIKALADRLEAATPALAITPVSPPPADPAPPLSMGRATPQPAPADPPVGDAAAAARLAATERRLALLIEQYAAAHRLRLAAVKQAGDARAQVSELAARQNQIQLEMQEAQLRADKAEKRYAALEQAQERLVSERERLVAELDQNRERLAESLKQTVALDARLAAAEARVAQLEGDARARANGPAGASIGPGLPPTTGDGQGSAPGGDGAAVPAGGAGLGSAEGPTTVSPPPTPAANSDPLPRVPPPAVYVVRPEDTLSKISTTVYGNPADWRRIYEANRDKLPTPDRLDPGMTLLIP